MCGPVGSGIPAPVSPASVRQDGYAAACLSAPVFVVRRRVFGGGIHGGGRSGSLVETL